jgi:hypothetical protein
MTGMMPEDWFSICLIGAPDSRMFERRSATPPPRLESCRAELMPRAIDSMLSSMRSRKQLTSSPRCALPVLRKVGVAGWKRPEMISSTSCSARRWSPSARPSAVDDAVLEALEVALAVEGLERVARVVLERAEERLEAELRGVRAVVEALDELERVLLEHGALVVLLLDEVVEPLLERVEEHRVLVDVLQEVLARRPLVGVELDLPVLAVEVQHRVEGVVVQAFEARRS